MNYFLKNYTDIIWDWNGTLFNDVELCVEIMNLLLTQESLPKITTKYYKEIFTFPVIDYYKKAGHTFEKNSFDDLGRQFMVEYELQKLNYKLFDGVVELLSKIKDMKIQQHLLSAYEHNNLQNILKTHHIHIFFNTVLGLDNIYAHGKLQLAQKLLEIIESRENNAKILLIGDTIHDYEVSKVLHSDCILLAHGHQDETRFLNLDIPVARDLKELAVFLNHS